MGANQEDTRTCHDRIDSIDIDLSIRFPAIYGDPPIRWEVNGRATVTGKFDSIDSIVDPIRCRCLRLVGWACRSLDYSSDGTLGAKVEGSGCNGSW